MCHYVVEKQISLYELQKIFYHRSEINFQTPQFFFAFSLLSIIIYQFGIC